MSTTELQELEGAVTTTAPSGLEIVFRSKPKRCYVIDGTEVPSVSAVLDILDKPALKWWGMTVGVDGVNELVRLGLVKFATNDIGQLAPVVERDGVWAWAVRQEIVDLLTANKLTVNHVRDKASRRGGNVHDALELWGMTKMLPVVENYPEEERKYVEALRAFLELTQGNIEVEALEVMVGSKQYGYAGRFDLRATFAEPFEVACKVYPKKKPTFTTIEPGPWIIDLKTSKGVYLSHFQQLEAYNLAALECGYPETTGRAVLHVQEDGRYEFVPSKINAESFLALLKAKNELDRDEEAMKS